MFNYAQISIYIIFVTDQSAANQPSQEFYLCHFYFSSVNSIHTVIH